MRRSWGGLCLLLCRPSSPEPQREEESRACALEKQLPLVLTSSRGGDVACQENSGRVGGPFTAISGVHSSRVALPTSSLTKL